MNGTTLQLAPTLAPLVEQFGGDPRAGLRAMAGSGVRYVQLSAAIPGMRPRELDRSARRDLLARLRRLELTPSGIDLWIPLEHFHEGAHLDRAMAAVLASIELAADVGGIPLSIEFPDNMDATQVQALRARADVCNVDIADFGRAFEHEFGIGIDPASELMSGDDPSTVALQAKRLVAARLSDADRAGRVVPGRGRLDLLSYRTALVTAGYRSPVTLDLRGLANPSDAMPAAQSKWDEADPFST